MTKSCFIYVLTIPLLFFLCLTVYAEPSVLINEVLIDASPQSIEIINTSSESADISGWYLDDSGGTTYYTIPSNTILYPGLCTVFSSDFNLNKASSDASRLFSNAYPPTDTHSFLIDSYAYKKSFGPGISYVRIPDGSTNWSTASASLGLFNGSLTPCIVTPTPIPSPSYQPHLPTLTSPPSPTLFITPSFQNIYISEFMAYPETGGNEWVEIYNDNDFDVELVDWYIDDVENGGSAPKKISAAISKKEYAVIDFTSSTLNNDADQVRLLNSEKIIMDELEYQNAIQGTSYGRLTWNSDTLCIQEPSKGFSNHSCIAQPSITHAPISSSRSSTENTKKLSTSIPKVLPVSTRATYTSGSFSSPTTHVIIPQQNVLGISTHNGSSPSALPYLLFISGSYSILTICSVLVKMRYVKEA